MSGQIIALHNSSARFPSGAIESWKSANHKRWVDSEDWHPVNTHWATASRIQGNWDRLRAENHRRLNPEGYRNDDALTPSVKQAKKRRKIQG